MGLANKEVKTEFVKAEKSVEIVLDGKVIPNNHLALKDIDFSKDFDGHEIIKALGVEDKIIYNTLSLDEKNENWIYYLRTRDYVWGNNPEFEQMTFLLQVEKPFTKPEKQLFAVDGKILYTEQITNIEYKNYESATVLSGKHATEKYGEVAKDASVIDLKTGEPNVKVYSNTSIKEKVVKGKVTNEKGEPIEGVDIYNKFGNKLAESNSKGEFDFNFEKENDNIIFVKEGFQPKHYEIELSEKKKIEIEVQLEKKKEQKNINNDSLIIRRLNKKSDKKPFIIVDGKEYKSLEGTNISSEGISRIEVVKDESAIQKYGEKARDGVINITTKNNPNVKIEPTVLASDPSEPIYVKVEDMPEFPGGELALRKYIVRSVKYPVITQESGIEGKVYVSFIIDKYGEVTNARVVKSVEELLDQEALRVINSLPRWKPGKQNGEVVNVSYTVPISSLVPSHIISFLR